MGLHEVLQQFCGAAFHDGRRNVLAVGSFNMEAVHGAVVEILLNTLPHGLSQLEFNIFCLTDFFGEMATHHVLDLVFYFFDIPSCNGYLKAFGHGVDTGFDF